MSSGSVMPIGAPLKSADDQGESEGNSLSRRDWLLIPIISVATILCLVGFSELAARHYWTERGGETCTMPDPVLGYRFRPNCTSRIKAPESPEVTNTYNECGYRTFASCGPKKPNVIRIAILGSSFAEGYLIPISETFGSEAGEQLARLCGRAVEIENMGAAKYDLLDSYHRVKEALALSPDLLIMALSPFDLERQIDPNVLATRDHPETLVRTKAQETPPGVIKHLREIFSSSRAILGAQHLLFRNRDTYIHMYMLGRGSDNFIHEPLGAQWELRLRDTDLLLGEMAQRARLFHVPFVLLFAPQEIQVALLNAQFPPKGLNAGILDDRMKRISDEHGFPMIDTLVDLAKASKKGDFYYRVDGHISGPGHAIVANDLVKGVLSMGLPAFSECAARGSASAEARQ